MARRVPLSVAHLLLGPLSQANANANANPNANTIPNTNLNNNPDTNPNTNPQALTPNTDQH